MKRLLLITALAAPVQAQAVDFYGELALGLNTSEHMPWTRNGDGGFSGGNDTIRFTVGAEFKYGISVKFSHISHAGIGWPFEESVPGEEDWLDVLEIGFKFNLGRL